MNRYLISALSILLSASLILSACKKEEDTPVTIPDPDPIFNFIGDVGYTSTDTELPIGSLFKVGVIATAASGKKLVSFVVVRTYSGVPDTLIKHSFYAPELTWDEVFPTKHVSGEEMWTFYIEDENGKSATLSFVITTFDPKPAFTFINGNGYVSGNMVLDINTEFMAGINASSAQSGADLANLIVLRNFENSGPDVVVDMTVSGQSLSWDSVFTSNSYAGYESWTFIIIDIVGKRNELSFIITTEDPGGGGDIVSYPNITLGSYNDPSYGSFFSTATGTVYSRVEAGQNQAMVDFAFYLGAVNKSTLGAPSNYDIQAVFELLAAGWTTFNKTLFQEAAISADEFDAIGTYYTFPPYSGTQDDINELEADDVVFFKTVEDKYGYIKVNSINQKGDIINIDVKVQI